MVLHLGEHQIDPLRQRAARQIVGDLLVDRGQLLVGAALVRQALHLLADRIVSRIELQRAAGSQEGSVLLPKLVLADVG